MDGLFAELDDEGRFTGLVSKHFLDAPGDIKHILHCQNNLDYARINYAYKEYQQNINKFSVLLHSKNPDHYKRSGALLHALYTSQIITQVVFLEDQLDDLETGFMKVSYGDAQFILKFVDFYKEFHNGRKTSRNSFLRQRHRYPGGSMSGRGLKARNAAFDDPNAFS